MKPVRIAIVGGGASGTLTLAHLLRQEPPAPVAITLYDRFDRFARGIAYSTTEPRHLLNVRTAGMSALQDDHAHFAEWAAPKGIGARDFAPRMVYGDYLQDVLDETLRTAEDNGHSLTLRRADIRAIRKAGGRFVLATPESEAEADFVIYAAGNNKPLSPKGAEELGAGSGYHADPWPADFAAVDRDARVCILGTGLSMVDAVISLDRAGHRGLITAVSRYGLLPAPHDETETPDFLIELDPAQMPRTACEVVSLVRAHVELAQREGYSWQGAVNGMRSVTNRIWENLSPGEQKRLRRAIPFWGVLRHRMAPEPAALLTELCAGGRLLIKKDTIESVGREGGLVVRGRKGTLQADHVFNCLGYGCETHPLETEGTPGFYSIGPALCGRLLETTAIPEIRQTAQVIAAGLREKIRVILN